MSAMQTRVLGPEEWLERGSSTLAAPLVQYVTPENVSLVVVEDEGKMVASVAAIRVTHFEGLWMDSAHRGNPGIMRGLLRKATSVAKERGEHWVIAGADGEQMRGFTKRLGGIILPLDFYLMWVGGKTCRQQQ